MDKIAISKDAPKEVTRESLIAIAYSMPDKTHASKQSSENLESQKQLELDCDGADKYRSELISISSSQSLDIQGLVVTLGEWKGLDVVGVGTPVGHLISSNPER